MTCICIDDLRPASFRGVGFFVANDKGEYGRRNITHEYPMRDTPYIEDMGQKATKYSVSGYLFGDDWVAQKDAIVAACTARGPALLQLPTEGPVMVNCNTLAVSRSKDECGFYTLQFEFVASSSLGAPSAVGVVESIIGAIFNSAIAPMTAQYDLAYTGDNTLQWVTDNQMARLTQLSADVILAVETSTSTNDTLSADVVQAAIGIFQNAPEYVQPSDSSLAAQPVSSQTIYRVATTSGYDNVGPASGISVTSAASAIVPVIAYMVNGIGNSMDVDSAITTLTTLSAWSMVETSLSDAQTAASTDITGTQVSTPLAPSDEADAVNGTSFCGVVRSFALMKLAQAISVKNFLTRKDAIQARANVVELFNSQIEEFDEDIIVNILLSARDNCVTAVTQKMATLVTVLEISAPQSRPSLYWASRLYRDLTRAEELSDRNNIASPAFMPRDFEALAS
jgi:prophage DNA circulation protein